MPSRNPVLVIALAMTAAWAHGVRAQGDDAYSRGEAFEQKGQFAEAATAYGDAVSHDPTALPALLGLERVDAQLGRLEQFLPVLERAIATKPQLSSLREAQLRTIRTIGSSSLAPIH